MAVKTHDSSLQWSGGRRVDSSRPMFDKAIFLIRNPFQANIAEWNRQMSKKHASDQVGSSHVKYVTSKAFFGKYTQILYPTTESMHVECDALSQGNKEAGRL